MIEARSIYAGYDGRNVLDDVSLTLTRGRVTALLGPNGAGKSTLLRALNGTVHITSGQVLVDGRPLAELSRREIARQIAVVAQENETRFPVTVLDHVLSGRYVHGGVFGWETTADMDLARNVLAECDLGGYDARQMNHLSGGERQRVVLARALAAEARTLLLDEPTANLDLAHQALMFRSVRNRCFSHGAAAMVITHDVNLAAEFADEIVLIKAGRIAASGQPDEVLTVANVQEVFGVEALVDRHPASGKVRVTTVHAGV